jgi:hypothetical protein
MVPLKYLGRLELVAYSSSRDLFVSVLALDGSVTGLLANIADVRSTTGGGGERA